MSIQWTSIRSLPFLGWWFSWTKMSHQSMIKEQNIATAYLVASMPSVANTSHTLLKRVVVSLTPGVTITCNMPPPSMTSLYWSVLTFAYKWITARLAVGNPFESKKYSQVVELKWTKCYLLWWPRHSDTLLNATDAWTSRLSLKVIRWSYRVDDL